MSAFNNRIEEMKTKVANFNKFRIIGARGIGAGFNYSKAAKNYVNSHRTAAEVAQEKINRKYAKGLIGWRNKNLNAFWKAVKGIRNLESKRPAATLPAPAPVGGQSRAIGLAAAASTGSP